MEETKAKGETSLDSKAHEPMAPENTGYGNITLPNITLDAKGVATVVAPPDPSVEESRFTQKQWQERRFAQQDKMIDAMINIFAALNGAVMFFVFIAWAASYSGKTEIITEKVVISLIGATVIQAGIAFITITRFLFPSGGDTPSQGDA